MQDRFLIGLVAVLATAGIALVAPRFAMFLVGGGYYTLPGTSMEPTLRVKDAVLSLPLDAGAIERGMVVVYHHTPSSVDYISRIVGLPGDRVAMRDGELILNGTVVSRAMIADYVTEMPARLTHRTQHCVLAEGADTAQCAIPRYRETLPNGTSYDVLDLAETPTDNTAEFTVSEGSVFVLSDNRDNAIDSRFESVGQIPVEDVTQKLWIRYLDLSGANLPDDRFLDRIN